MDGNERGRCGALHSARESRSKSLEPGIESPLYVRGRRCRYHPATADQIVEAARQVVDRRIQRGASFKDPSVSRGYFQGKLAGLEREVFAAAFLDTRHRLIEYAELFQGTVDGAEVHPREVVRLALVHNAAAVIVAHNHPSGDVEPSAADRAVTIRLKQALALVDVRLLDHVIVGGTQALAMAEKGWL
jgi:DNA repair protein RadC